MADRATRVLARAPDASADDIYYAWSEALTLDYADDNGDPAEPMSMFSEDCGQGPGGWVVFDTRDAVKITLAPQALRRGRALIGDIVLAPVDRGLIEAPSTRKKR